MRRLDYFAEEEQEIQERFKSKRDRIFSPIVRILARLKVSPDFVSLWGMLMLAPFGYWVIAFRDPPWIAGACLFLALHVLLDGLDGPLARFYGTAGPSGAFVDICCDHGGMVIVTWILSYADVIDGTVGNIYVFLYTMAVVFIMWLNHLGRPFRWVFRSKYVFYALIFAHGMTAWEILNPALLAFSAANLWLCVLGFLRVRRLL